MEKMSKEEVAEQKRKSRCPDALFEGALILVWMGGGIVDAGGQIGDVPSDWWQARVNDRIGVSRYIVEWVNKGICDEVTLTEDGFEGAHQDAWILVKQGSNPIPYREADPEEQLKSNNEAEASSVESSPPVEKSSTKKSTKSKAATKSKQSAKETKEKKKRKVEKEEKPSKIDKSQFSSTSWMDSRFCEMFDSLNIAEYKHLKKPSLKFFEVFDEWLEILHKNNSESPTRFTWKNKGTLATEFFTLCEAFEECCDACSLPAQWDAFETHVSKILDDDENAPDIDWKKRLHVKVLDFKKGGTRYS